MNTQQFLKGLMMALVAVIVTAFSTTPINWILMAISAVSAIVIYFGKNLIPWLHSDSPVGSLSFLNIFSGVLIAAGTGLVDGLAQYFIEGVVLWSALWKLVVFVTLTYITSTLFAPPYSTKPVKFFGK